MGDYKIDIQKDLIQDINQFTSINSKNNSKGSFKLTKNHESSNTFYRYRNIEQPKIVNQNDKEFFKNKIQQLEMMNKEHNQINQQLTIENQMLKQELKNIEMNLQKNNEKIHLYQSVKREKEQNKLKEEMEYGKKATQNFGEENKTVKIKLLESSAKIKK